MPDDVALHFADFLLRIHEHDVGIRFRRVAYDLFFDVVACDHHRFRRKIGEPLSRDLIHARLRGRPIRLAADDQHVNFRTFLSSDFGGELRRRGRSLFQMHRDRDALPRLALADSVTDRQRGRGRIADDAHRG